MSILSVHCIGDDFLRSKTANDIMMTINHHMNSEQDVQHILSLVPVRSPATEQDALADVIETLMTERQVFLMPRYSLDDLARDIGVPRHRLTATFNKAFGINFPSYINRKRIEYMLKNVNDPEWSRYTLEGIGRACGFNSRNAYIKCIKKFLGKNPSEVVARSRA